MGEDIFTYYRKLPAISLYRTFIVNYNDGTTGMGIQRWNWDTSDWHGHISDYEKTIKQIKAGIEIVPSTKDEVRKLTHC